MLIRPYQSADCAELVQLFQNTVHAINVHDYNFEQIRAWANGKVDLPKWDQSLLANYSLVAVKDNRIVGFGDIDATGYLDRLYVHASYQGQGIATALCDKLEQAVQGDITTHASITALPFFEQRGYQVLASNEVVRNGVTLKNFKMIKKRHQEASTSDKLKDFFKHHSLKFR